MLVVILSNHGRAEQQITRCSAPVNINFGLGSKELSVVNMCIKVKSNDPYEGTKTHKLAQQNNV